MTQRRQERNRGAALRTVVAVAGLVAAGLGLAAPALAQATTEQVVIDRSTGLALGGHDAVAYFTDGKAMAGREEFELIARGAVWRFVNAGNRAAFLADPNVYAPQFGGYDPLDVARGAPVPGLPALWAVVNQRLFLFSRPVSREDFLADPDNALEAARKAWPKLRETLAH